VAGCCEYGDEPAGSVVTDLVNSNIPYERLTASVLLIYQLQFSIRLT
jgi:hypothetical protein